MADKEYDIGYGKPPEESRFIKGKSGNPKGRPKGSRNTYKLLDGELSKNLTIVQDGKPAKISKKNAILLQIVNAAAKGNHKAISTILPHMLAMDAKNEALGRGAKDMSKEDKALIKQYIKDHADE